MSKTRDIANFLGKTEAANTGNAAVANSLDQFATPLDSAYVTSVVNASALTVLSSLDSLPSSSLTQGRTYFTKNSPRRLYISTGTGYYNVATINLTPTMSLSPEGTIAFTPESLEATVTITATDSDDPISNLSYSVESDGNGIGLYVLSQDSSVFTIRALSEDSGGTDGTFTLTFKTTDNINTASATKDFSLAFTIPPVSGSASTIALMKASGNSATNADITYQNSSDVSTGFTETGDPQASTFSPYRSGGYSTYFDGTGDYITFGHAALGTGDWTIEGWVRFNSISNQYIFDFRNAGSGTTAPALDIQTDWRYISDNAYRISSGVTPVANRWYHFAVVKYSGTTTLYVDGSSLGTYADSLNYVSEASANIGVFRTKAVNYLNGYLRDFRVSSIARYTAAFDVPTEPLQSDGDTELLACHLPYFGDGSTNNHTLTVNGDTKTSPFGPYDYSPWTADDVGGSVYFDGSGDFLETGPIVPLTGNFTIETWVNISNAASSRREIFSQYSGGEGRLTLYSLTNSTFEFFIGTSLGNIALTSSTFQINTWYHLAVVRNSNNFYFYVNGKLEASDTGGKNVTIHNGDVDIGQRFSADYMFGYISDLRVVSSAQYTSAFTPPSAPLSHTGSGTSMLMNNKSDANIYDAASAGRISLMGNANTNTSVRKFTTSSSVAHGANAGVRFDELTPEYLGGDFTIQFWLYPTAWYNNGHIFGHWVGGQYHPWLVYTSTTTYWKFYASSNGSTWNLVSAGNTSIDRWTNSWKHVAMTYDQSAGTVKFWLDGTLESTFTGITGLTSNSYTSSVLSFGEDQNSGYPGYAGYLQDIKVSRSVDYTAAFTPPTTEFEL